MLYNLITTIYTYLFTSLAQGLVQVYGLGGWKFKSCVNLLFFYWHEMATATTINTGHVVRVVTKFPVFIYCAIKKSESNLEANVWVWTCYMQIHKTQLDIIWHPAELFELSIKLSHCLNNVITSFSTDYTYSCIQ